MGALAEIEKELGGDGDGRHSQGGEDSEGCHCRVGLCRISSGVVVLCVGGEV